MPRNVEELRIESCQLTTGNLKKILAALQESYIESFSLVNCSALSDQDNLKLLTDFIAVEGRYLHTIDISYNKLTLAQISPVLNAICSNKRLEYVNLSWNYLTENSNFGNPGSTVVDDADLDKRGTNRKRIEPEQIKKTKKQLALEKAFGKEE